MNKIVVYFILIFLIGINQNVLAEPEENEFGIVNAWYNGQEATVKDVQLKINEPAEIRVEVTSKINGHVAIYLDNPLVTESYKVITGPSQIDKRIDALNVEPGWSKIYSWTIAPTGEWTNGNAPINLFVQFTKAINDDQSIEFTIANPIILDEQYTGPGLTHTTDQSSNDNSTSTSTSQGSPGFGIFAVLLGMALVVMWKHRR